MDVEELAAKGGELNGCAYYAARRAAQQAEILLMPYSSLLHEETRKLLGVRLRGSVIVLDEAHNVGEAVSASYSATVTQHHLEIACSALKNYIDRFRSRLGPSNLRHLSMLYEVASCLQRTIESSSSSIMEGLYDFVKRAEIHNIDVFRLTNFVRESKILLKLSNYGEYVEDSNLNSKDEEASALSALQSLTSFISALGSSESDGRILIELNSCEEKTQRQLKYLLVDSSSRFVSLASDARAIIFAGGTLSPTEALLNQLVPNIRASRVVRTLTCGHIVPDGNLLCCALASGPTGYSLNFSFKRRDFQATDELGRVVLNMCKIAPGGIVVFLPSFQYMQSVIERWHSNGTISAVKKHKNLHWEPRSASEVEQTLSSHASDANESHHGALLLCVVGAKLSEGVNFADATGRCIILAGLPYPSPNDVELRERMRFHDELKRKANDEGRPDASELPSGRDLYESLCSRAVNQAVGRAIRHVNDWAAVVLADERFAASEGDGARSRLSDWMAKSLKVPRTFGEFCRVSAAFFKGKRTKGENVPWVH
jgi:chromosome transmission fidelity protein 1